MAKRFIDTGLFDDPWFMDLSKDTKILWLYLITKCDHAGIICFNERLCKLQTGIDSLIKSFEQLGNRCLTVREQYKFIPKFIYYQYPNFPNSQMKAQLSAIIRLKELDLISEDGELKFQKNGNSSVTVNKQLDNSYGKGNSITNNNKGEILKKISPEEFYKNQLEISNNDSFYLQFIDILYGRSKINSMKLTGVLTMEEQLTFDDFKKLIEKCKLKSAKLSELIMDLENGKYWKKYKTIYYTINGWLNKRP